MNHQITGVGLLRLNQILGEDEVTEQQAEENRKCGKGPKRKRDGIPAIIPVKKSCWYQGIKDGRYPRPVKISPRCSAWKISDILDLIESA